MRSARQPLKLLVPSALAQRRLVLAYSGGVDSTVLLDLLSTSARHRLRAIHVHHGLQAAADAWAGHCLEQCARIEVPCGVVRITVPVSTQGPEAAARQARYEALRQDMQPGEVLVTAHHLDDQAETVLMRLLRGSGPDGLSGMRALDEFAPGMLWRPLLDTPRAQILDWAHQRGLNWIEDPHNQDPRYARSALRTEILPRLRRHWPELGRAIARSAAVQAETGELLHALADADLSAITSAAGPGANPLSLTALQRLAPARRRNLLRHWIAALGLSTPYRDSLIRFDRELLGAGEDSHPVLAWPGTELRRYRDQLWAVPTLDAVPQAHAQAWDGRLECILPPGCGRLVGSAARQSGESLAYEVRIPVPVTQFQPVGSAHRRSLKNLFQERGIPPWVRLRTPALLRQGRVCWIAGLGWAAGEPAFALRWMDPPPGADPS